MSKIKKVPNITIHGIPVKQVSNHRKKANWYEYHGNKQTITELRINMIKAEFVPIGFRQKLSNVKEVPDRYHHQL